MGGDRIVDHSDRLAIFESALEVLQAAGHPVRRLEVRSGRGPNPLDHRLLEQREHALPREPRAQDREAGTGVVGELLAVVALDDRAQVPQSPLGLLARRRRPRRGVHHDWLRQYREVLRQPRATAILRPVRLDVLDRVEERPQRSLGALQVGTGGVVGELLEQLLGRVLAGEHEVGPVSGLPKKGQAAGGPSCGSSP